MIRKRGIVKLLVLVPFMWLAVVVFLNPSLESNNNKQILGEEERLQNLLKVNHDHMREMMKKNDEEKKAIIKMAYDKMNEAEVMKEKLKKDSKNKEKDVHEKKNDDHDHPEEEKNKAVQQVQDNAIHIQVQAPGEKNNSAPGKFRRVS
jgi:hypothetical protein